MATWYNVVVRTLVASVFFVVASAGTAPAQLTFRNASTRSVLSTMSPPILGVVKDMVAAEGDTVAQTIRASDPDLDYLDFYGIHFFPFMRIDPISHGPSDASARIVLTPRPGQDHGRATVGVGVTDGVSSAEAPFNITILEKHPGSTWLALRVEPRPWDIVWDSVRFDQLDGAFSASGTAETGVTITFDPPEPLTKDSSVALSCMPAQRPACVSDRVNWWQLRFEPPLGGALEPGLYEGATGSPDAQYAALQVSPFCGSVRSCTVADSWFEVREAVFDLAGAPVSFWATFERRCSDSPTVISGEIRYSASPPVFVDAPSRVEAHAGALLEVDMPVGGTASEPRSVVSPDLPPGASLTMVTPDQARLVWTPGLDQAGSYDLRLLAQAPLAAPDTVGITICVDVPGALTATMDVNRTTVITTNQGDAAYDAARSAPGVLHPAGSIPVANAIGLALAAKVDGEVRVSLRGGYPAYAPGPLVNGLPAPFMPEFKNYTIRRSEPSGYDWEHWPVDQGAPVDGFGRPLILGDVTIWSLYNDARLSVPPEPPRATLPLGVEVRQTTWAGASPTPLGDVVFQRFQVRNASADTLDEAYAGLLVDATTFEFYGHVGEPSRNLIGCDTTLGLGYAYSAESCGLPNAVGVAILRGPVTSTGIAGADTLGLTAFQERGYFSSDPVGGIYNQLRGLFPHGEARHEFDDLARPTTTYAFTGDPIHGTGWLDPPTCNSNGAEFYASTGPFRLLPGEEREILIAIVAATGSDRIDAVRRIREVVAAAREATVPVPNHTPIAMAGGPYQTRAGVPIDFDASGSFDPDGDPLSFAWEFGDGAMGGGVRASHAYAQDGAYTVVLVASDHAISDSDTTIAEVGTLSVETDAEAYVLSSDAVIRLASSRPYAWIAVEPGGPFRPSDVILSTVTLARADGSLVPIGPVQDESRIDVDEDGDGIQEIAMAFSKAELRSLLENLPPGRSAVPAVVTGDLQEGGSFTARLNLVVEAGRPGLHATVAPNPFNPGATLTIHTSRAGRMRVSLFNAAGQLVRTLLNAGAQPAGYHDIAMDRRSGEGATLASGIYFYRIESPEGSITGRFVILK